MTRSGGEPAERPVSFVTWGLAALGLTAAVFAISALKIHGASAQQQETTAGVNAAETAKAAQPAFNVRIVKPSAGKLKLRGAVGSEEDRRALMGLIKASFPSADVTERIKVAGGAHADIKLGGIRFALKALSFLQAGSAFVDDQGVTLAGDVESAAVYSDFKHFVSTPPTGIVLKGETVAPPPTSLSWRAEVGGGKVRLTGTVADSSDKKELEASVQSLFAGLEIVDETAVVAGTSDSWLDAAMHSLQVLRLLDSGFVQMADHRIQLYGQASDETQLHKIDQLADDYPAGFALDSKVSAPARTSSVVGTAAAAERVPALDLGSAIPGFDIAPAQ